MQRLQTLGTGLRQQELGQLPVALFVDPVVMSGRLKLGPANLVAEGAKAGKAGEQAFGFGTI